MVYHGFDHPAMREATAQHQYSYYDSNNRSLCHLQFLLFQKPA